MLSGGIVFADGRISGDRIGPMTTFAEPVAHLSYHAARYGKFALGFRRSAVIRHGFNPVFYTSHHAEVMQSIYAGFAEIESFDADSLREEADVIKGEAESCGIYLGWEAGHLTNAADDIEDSVQGTEASNRLVYSTGSLPLSCRQSCWLMHQQKAEV
jgi:hypothetical protein